MQKASRRFILMGILTLLVLPAVAQEFKIKLEGKSEENIFLLTECMAVIVDEDETIMVQMMLPAESRPEGYDDIDLKKGDEILMLNAKRVKKVKDLKEIYEGLDAGETVKLGIRRKEEMFIVSFDKVDPEKLPKRRLKISREGGGAGAGKMIKLINTGDGFVIKEVDNQVFVHRIFPQLQKVFEDADLREGDLILTLADKKIESNQQFVQIWSKITTGSELSLGISRDGKQKTITFKKPEPISE